MQNDASKDKTNLTVESIRTLTTAMRLGRRYIQEMRFFIAELMYSARLGCVWAPVHRLVGEGLSEPEDSKV
jgi:hypothetical protein